MYSEKDYNPITYQQAVEADSVTAYLASKRFAEAAAFEFVEKNKPQFGIFYNSRKREWKRVEERGEEGEQEQKGKGWFGNVFYYW